LRVKSAPAVRNRGCRKVLAPLQVVLAHFSTGISDVCRFDPFLLTVLTKKKEKKEGGGRSKGG
jgi:hypothetical protein